MMALLSSSRRGTALLFVVLGCALCLATAPTATEAGNHVLDARQAASQLVTDGTVLLSPSASEGAHALGRLGDDEYFAGILFEMDYLCSAETVSSAVLYLEIEEDSGELCEVDVSFSDVDSAMALNSEAYDLVGGPNREWTNPMSATVARYPNFFGVTIPDDHITSWCSRPGFAVGNDLLLGIALGSGCNPTTSFKQVGAGDHYLQILTDGALMSNPATPHNLTVTLTAPTVTISWDPAPYSATVTKYKLERALLFNFLVGRVTLTDSMVTSFEDSSFVAGVLNYYRVSAYTENEGYGSTVSDSLLLTGLASPPIDLNATVVSPTEVALSWDEPLFLGGILLLSYTVVRAEDSGFIGGVGTVTSGGLGTAVTANGLTPGTPYWFSVEAVTALGLGEPAYIGPIVPVGAAPSVPLLVTWLIVSPTSVGLAWTPPALMGDGLVTSYLVEMANDAAFTNVTTVSDALVLALNVTVPTGVDRYLRVSARNAHGLSPPAVVSGPVRASGVPDAPASITSTLVSISELDLAWSPPAQDNGQPILGYLLVRDTLPSLTVPMSLLTTNLTLFADTGLAANTTYYYAVSAFNLHGYGPALVGSWTMPVGPPLAPPSFVANVTSPTSIVLSWDAADSQGSPSLVYTARLATDAGMVSGLTVLLNAAGSLAVAANGLTPGDSYWFDLVAISVAGISVPAVLGPIVPSGLPGPPASPSLVAFSPTAVTLAWAAPLLDGGLVVLSYTIERDTESDFGSPTVVSASSTALVLNDTGLSPATAYYYRLTASNANGLGLAVVVSVTTPPLIILTTPVPPSTTMAPFTGLRIDVNGHVWHGEPVLTTTAGLAVRLGITLDGLPLPLPLPLVGTASTVRFVVTTSDPAVAVVDGDPFVSFGDLVEFNETATVVVRGVMGSPSHGTTSAAFSIAISPLDLANPVLAALETVIPGICHYVHPLAIDAVLPSSVVPASGGRVTVVGSGFGVVGTDADVAVVVGGVAAGDDALVSATDSRLVLDLWAQPGGSYVDLTVTNLLTGASHTAVGLLFFSASFCLDPGTIEDPDGSGGCVACPDGATCPGGGRIRPDKGHWSPGEDSGIVISCFPAYRCDGNGTCADGHGDFACSVCDDGYTYSNGDCQECPSSTTNMVLVLVDYAYALILVWVVLRASDVVLQRFVLFAVVVQLLRLSVGSSVGRIPGAVFDFMAVVGTLGGEPSNAGSACHRNTTGHAAVVANLAGNAGQYNLYFYRSVITMLAGYGVTAAAIVIMIMWRRRDAAKRAWWKRRLGSSLIGGAMVSYYHATHISIRSLICTRVGGEYGWKLRADLSMTCYEGAHWMMVAVAVAMLALITVVFPVYLMVATRRLLKKSAASKATEIELLEDSTGSGSSTSTSSDTADAGVEEQEEVVDLSTNLLTEESRVATSFSNTTIGGSSSPPASSRFRGTAGNSGKARSCCGGSPERARLVSLGSNHGGDPAEQHPLSVVFGRFDRGRGWWLLPVWLVAAGFTIVATELALSSPVLQLSVVAAVALWITVVIGLARPLSDWLQNLLLAFPPVLTLLGATAVGITYLSEAEEVRSWAAAGFIIAVVISAAVAHGLYFFVIRQHQDRSRQGVSSRPASDRNGDFDDDDDNGGLVLTRVSSPSTPGSRVAVLGGSANRLGDRVEAYVRRQRSSRRNKRPARAVYDLEIVSVSDMSSSSVSVDRLAGGADVTPFSVPDNGDDAAEGDNFHDVSLGIEDLLAGLDLDGLSSDPKPAAARVPRATATASARRRAGQTRRMQNRQARRNAEPRTLR